jgi:glycosyltransferase involved in cell wall biosynthesis/peptidoglycan/xylan/chitin deacetylase (PgdA/CDA1 family)
MFFTKAYYVFKPVIPWGLRTAVRRRWARARRTAHAHVWPIDEKAGAIPPGWPGWPAGKRFALILSHDVEGKKGLSRVEKLMELESKQGFRSSFNFVPEGEYRVPDALRQTLDKAGFEVGIHGLEHDGKLYASKAGFASKAARIKQYAKHWKASGFRSPLMQHRLGWLHQLGMDYDASTFDTDPFEPEPDGVGTVFPFWVPGVEGRGYVELPYTLPQDFTLFVVLREPNIDLWKRKLDWIAERGGMALLNTHPDYMCFESNGRQRDEYPVSYYEEFLSYARETYKDAYWAALPREVSRFYCANVPCSSRNSRKKICMLAYTLYESDSRVRHYAEALAKRGDQVDVIALSDGQTSLGAEDISGVALHRVQRRDFDEQGKWTYAWRLLRFLLASSVFLMRRHYRTRYDFIHVHNVPDFLVLAAWYPKWTGAKLILDIHDLVPELFASKFEPKEGNHYIQLLRMVEKASAAFVDHVIVSNHLWHQTLISRSVPKEKCSVFLNNVDPAIFYRRPRTRSDGKVIILFPGTFQRHQGLDIAIEAFAQVKDKVPNAEFHLYGGGGVEADLVRLAERLGLKGRVKFCGRLSQDGIAEVIANADLGVVPKRANLFGNEAYSTKIMEFMSQGVPVVASRTKIDTFYFNDKIVRFFTSDDVQDMAEAMLQVIENQSVRNELVAGGYEYADRHNWDTRKRDYLELVDSLSTEQFGGSNQQLLDRHRIASAVTGVTGGPDVVSPHRTDIDWHGDGDSVGMAGLSKWRGNQPSQRG